MNKIEETIIKKAETIFKTTNIKIIKRLLGGMSNYTYLISVNNKKYTFRLPGEHSELFVNRKDEEYNLKLIENLKISTETCYFNLESGIKVSKYIEGVSLDKIKLKKQDYIKIASILKKLHTSNLKAKSNFNLINILDKYEKNVKNIDKDYFNLKINFINLYKPFSKLEKVFLHGDCQQSNFIYTSNNDIILVDFEFSSNQTPLLDIAVFGHNDFNNSIKLYEAYYNKKINNKDLYILHLFRLQQYLQWYLVAKAKDELNMSKKLKCNFNTISKKYLNKAIKHYNYLKESPIGY